MSGVCVATAILSATCHRFDVRLIRTALLLPRARSGTLSSRLRGWRWRRLRAEATHRPRDLRADLRIHVRGPGIHDVHRDAIAAREPRDVVVRARQVMRHHAFGPIHFGDYRARVRRDLLIDVEAV